MRSIAVPSAAPPSPAKAKAGGNGAGTVDAPGLVALANRALALAGLDVRVQSAEAAVSVVANTSVLVAATERALNLPPLDGALGRGPCKARLPDALTPHAQPARRAAPAKEPGGAGAQRGRRHPRARLCSSRLGACIRPLALRALPSRSHMRTRRARSARHRHAFLYAGRSCTLGAVKAAASLTKRASVYRTWRPSTARALWRGTTWTCVCC